MSAAEWFPDRVERNNSALFKSLSTKVYGDGLVTQSDQHCRPHQLWLCSVWLEGDFALTRNKQWLCREPCSFKHDWGQLQTRAIHVCVWIVTVVCWHQLGLLSLNHNKDHLHCQLMLSKKYYICIQNQELYISHIPQPQPLSSVCFYRGHCCQSCRHPRETRAFKGLFGSWITIGVRNCGPAPCFQIIMVADSKSKELSTNWWHWNGYFDIGRRDERSKESHSTNSMISE